MSSTFRLLGLLYCGIYAVFSLLFGLIFVRIYFYGFDYTIYHQAAVKAVEGGSPYLPYVVGTSFLYHPAFLSLIRPLVSVPVGTAAVVWGVMSLAAYAGVWGMMGRLLRLTRQDAALWGVVMLLAVGAFESAWMGQVNMLVALLVTAALLLTDRRPVLAGVLMALAIVCKTTPALLLLYWACIGRWRVIAAALIGLVALSVLGVLMFGWSVLADFVTVSMQVSGATIGNPNNVSPAALMQSLGVSYGVATWVQRTIALGLLLPAVTLAYRRRDTLLAFAALLVVMVMASPIMWGHHIVLALPALMILGQRWRWGVLLALMLMQADFLLFVLAQTPTGLFIVSGWMVIWAGMLSQLVTALRQTD
jgi:hypothetical protein